MSTSNVMDVSERTPARGQDVGTGRRVGRRRHRAATVALAAIAFAISAVAGLLVPVGSVPSAHAEDGNPTFYLGANNGYQYADFINEIRSRVNDGGSSSVPRTTSSYDVGHTGNWPANNAADFFRVDIHMWGNPNFVRLQLRRSDLYLMGWWTGGSTYNYLGDRQLAGPSNGASHGEWRCPFGENYNNIEGYAGQTRAGLVINRDTVNAALWNLWDARDARLMARGVLMMTQFLSEAARFRPLRDEIALTMGGMRDGVPPTLHVPTEYAEQENDWGTLSGVFNALLRQPPGTVDTNALIGWGRIQGDGRPLRIELTTAVRYAQYVMFTSLRR
ncbi:MAG: ribosome-inactivating family protein [Umezawaea sp.]